MTRSKLFAFVQELVMHERKVEREPNEWQVGDERREERTMMMILAMGTMSETEKTKERVERKGRIGERKRERERQVYESEDSVQQERRRERSERGLPTLNFFFGDGDGDGEGCTRCCVAGCCCWC